MIKLFLRPHVPCGKVEPLLIERRGLALVLNGLNLDLSFMAPGDFLPSGAIDHPLLSGATIQCTRDGLEIHDVLFHISADQTDPAACFPEPLMMDRDGAVRLPSQHPKRGGDADQH